MPYLVDTGILIDFFRKNDAATDYLDSLRDWSLSAVTAMELAAGSKNQNEVRDIDLMLAAYRTIPLSEDVGELAYNLIKTYAKSNGLKPPDAIIAATAIHEGLKLSTRNEKHFR